MRFLLTSTGITNKSLHAALVGLLGKPISESTALVIPTAAYWFAQGPAIAYRLISGKARGPLCELGGKSVGVLELTALPSVDKENWVPLVREDGLSWEEAGKHEKSHALRGSARVRAGCTGCVRIHDEEGVTPTGQRNSRPRCASDLSRAYWHDEVTTSGRGIEPGDRAVED